MIVGGLREASRLLTEMAGKSAESGAEDEPGSTATGRGATADVTSAAANKAGGGGRHGARSGVRERVSGRREKPVRESSVVGGEGGGRKAYIVDRDPSGVRGGGKRP